jgi:hypothetical protein
MTTHETRSAIAGRRAGSRSRSGSGSGSGSGAGDRARAEQPSARAAQGEGDADATSIVRAHFAANPPLPATKLLFPTSC